MFKDFTAARGPMVKKCWNIEWTETAHSTPWYRLDPTKSLLTSHNRLYKQRNLTNAGRGFQENPKLYLQPVGTLLFVPGMT